MKTAMQILIEELKQASELGTNPFINSTINLIIDMAESKLETEKQQIIEAYKAGEKNIDFPALHGQGKLSDCDKYYTSTFNN